MADWKLRLYHQMPPFMRNWVASMRGYQLRSWRYGPETEQLVAEALERDHWSSEQWKTHQENRLQYVLHRAATQVPYYRQQWSDRRRKGDQSSWENLENWPVLTKEPIRENPKAFIADDMNDRDMFWDHTSGTSGTPLSLWWSKDTVRLWYALLEARTRRWYGTSINERWAMIGGQLVVPVQQTRPPFWVWNRGLNQLYLSSYHFSKDLMRHYLDALIEYEITHIYAYSSSVYTLAIAALASSRTDLKMTAVFTNAEPLYDYQRIAIQQAFQCPACQTYGMSEIVTSGSECTCGAMHLWPEVGYLEYASSDGQILKNVSGGRLIGTGLFNADMPFIRYKVGDALEVDYSTETTCACGKRLPAITSIEGRVDDSLLTPDGRIVGRLDPVFKADLPILEVQIIQETKDLLRVKCVKAFGYTESTEREIAARLRDRVGNMQVTFDYVDAIPREKNGKFRAVINAMESKRAT